MDRTSQPSHGDFAPLVSYWGRYCTLGDHHHVWMATHVRVRQAQRGTRLFASGNHPNEVYFVASGLLAGVSWDPDGRRRIRYLAPPTHVLMSAANLYTPRRVSYDIVALRKTRLLCVYADDLRAYKESCPEAAILVEVMHDRQLKQLRQQNALLLMPNEVDRYVLFYRTVPELRRLTTQQEQADYLNLSKMTVTRALRKIRETW